MNYNNLQPPKLKKRQAGFTLWEIVLVIAIGAILVFMGVSNLGPRKQRLEVELAGKQIVALLREAQSKAMAQSAGSAWGVYFENSTTTAPFYSIFTSTYANSTRSGYYRLSPAVVYDVNTLPLGASRSVIFTQLTGVPDATTTIRIYLRADASVSSTISITPTGSVTY